MSSQQLQSVDEGKMCHKIPLSMKLCGATQDSWPIGHILNS